MKHEQIQSEYSEIEENKIWFYVRWASIVLALLLSIFFSFSMNGKNALIREQKKEIETIKNSKEYKFGTEIKKIMDKKEEARLYNENAEKKRLEFEKVKAPLEEIILQLSN